MIVTLNADRLNSIETGFGYGTDTGFRVRGQYRRAIVNSRGHSFDANMEVSQIRQAVDVRYNIPYKHPLNDYISIVGGFERELDNDIGPNVTLETQTAVIGAERIIKNPLGGWQQTYGVRYRVDSLNQRGTVDESSLPDAFKVPGSDPNQQALLFGYSVSKTSSNNNINPTKGFKQTYKLQVASDALISDANIIMPAAAWRAIYSVGENDDHQFVGRADLGYIFTNDFEKVPYNLRYFAGGDESIRGFDYKSLAPLEFGYKVGGQALAVGSLEYNYQFKEGWRAAVFSDFGNAYDKDFNTPTEYGVGWGFAGNHLLDQFVSMWHREFPIQTIRFVYISLLAHNFKTKFVLGSLWVNSNSNQLKTRKKRRILRSVLFTFGIILLFLVSALTIMVSTDRGSKFCLIG